MLAMITAITIEYVEGMHLADQMFFCIGGEDVGYAGIKT